MFDEPDFRPQVRRGYQSWKFFKESTIQKVRELKDQIILESGGDPVLAAAIAGAFAEEHDDLNWIDAAQSAILSGYREKELKDWYERSNLEDLIEEPGSLMRNIQKATGGNPFKNDVGPANINLATAVHLVENGWLMFNNFDLSTPYTSIIRHLLTDAGAVKAVAADLRWGKAQLNELHFVFDRALPFEQEALLVSWFNEGPRFKRRIHENLIVNPYHAPQPNDPGEVYLKNRRRIRRALGLVK